MAFWKKSEPSIADRLMAILRDIRGLKEQLAGAEDDLKQLQELCPHSSRSFVSNETHDYMSCNDCGKLFQS